jgi:hypothetical protein
MFILLSESKDIDNNLSMISSLIYVEFKKKKKKIYD